MISTYNLRGERLKTYTTYSELTKDLGVTYQTVYLCLQYRNGYSPKFGLVFAEGSKEKIDTKHIEAMLESKAVSVYNELGEIIATYYSPSSLARNYNTTKESVYNAIHLRRLIKLGSESFYIAYGRDPLDIKQYQRTRGKTVAVYNDRGERIKSFRSISEAAKHYKVTRQRIHQLVKTRALRGNLAFRYTT